MNKPVSSRNLRTQLSLNNFITILLGLILLIVVNYFGYRYYLRKDLSQGKFYELSDKTVNIIKNLPDPVRITSCLRPSGLKEQVDALLSEYLYRGGSRVKVEKVDPDLDLDKADALANKFKFDPKNESLILVEYRDQHRLIDENQLADYDQGMPMMGTPPKMKGFKGEQQITAAIQSLVEGKPSKVYFLTGHGEREIGASGTIGLLEERIKRDNNTSAALNLAAVQTIPEDCDLLYIVGPRSNLAPPEVDAISDYLESARHGKVILFQDPETTSGLENLLQKYGMELHADMVLTRGRVQGMGEMVFASALGSTFADHPAVNSIKGFQLQLPKARSIGLVKDSANPNVAKVTQLIKTPPSFWGATNLKDRNPKFDPATDIQGPVTVAAVYDGGELPGEGVKVTGARLAVIGNSSFVTDQRLDGVGLDFVLNLSNWMMKKEIAIGISPKIPQEFGLDVSPLQRVTISILALAFVPLLALAFGVVIWFSRRK